MRRCCAYLGRRLVLAVLTVWFISVATFAIIHLAPGDYISTYVAEMAAAGSAMTEDEANALRHEYGLDQPLHPVRQLGDPGATAISACRSNSSGRSR